MMPFMFQYRLNQQLLKRKLTQRKPSGQARELQKFDPFGGRFRAFGTAVVRANQMRFQTLAGTDYLSVRKLPFSRRDYCRYARGAWWCGGGRRCEDFDWL
jgi:hypothetical protein